MRQLHPEPREIQTADLLAEVDFAAHAPDARPYVILNMIASVDGRAALHGRTRELGGPADHEMFHGLRTKVDAVMVGTGTLRAERYGPLLPDRDEQPLAIVCSRRGDFPTDVGLFTDPRSRVLAHTGEPGEALRIAREEHGVRSVLCEGGPTLNGAMFAGGLVDELFLTISPLVVSGPAPLTIVEAAGPERPVDLELAWLLEADGMLLCRYAAPRAG